MVNLLQWIVGSNLNTESDPGVKFQLSKEEFKRDFLPIYTQFGIVLGDETKLFQIAVPIPFFIPFPNGRTLTYSHEDSSILSIIFRDYERMVDIDPIGSISQKNLVKYSYIEILSVNSDKSWEDQLDKALEYVNIAVRAYTTLTEDLTVYPVNLRMLGVFALGRTVTYGTWSEEVAVYTLPNMNKIPHTKEYIAEENFAEISRLVSIDITGINGFVAVHEVLKASLREYQIGKYTESILLLNVFFEMFTKEIVKNIYLEEGRTQTETNAILETGYKNLRNHHLLKKLGISESHEWNQNYLKFIYELRNKIAHTGHIPTRQEADRTFVHADIYRKFLSKRIHRTQYFYLKKLLALKPRKFR